MQEYNRKAANLSAEIEVWLEKKGCKLNGISPSEADERNMNDYDRDYLDFSCCTGACNYHPNFSYSVADVNNYLEAWKNLDNDYPSV